MEPLTEHPWMPDYPLDRTAPPLPWSWALARVRGNQHWWLATASPDGRPNVHVVWAVWFEDAVWFSSGPTSRKVRNLEADPRATITTGDPAEPVVLQCTATRETATPAFVAAYEAVYGPSPGLEFFLANACFRLVPEVAFGLIEEEFLTSPTRWTF